MAETRLDVHNGASATGVGTTNAAVRAGIVDLLGIAIESGAITQSVNGSALTLQANALSLERFATNQDVFAVCPGGTLSCENGYEQFLRNLSASATMSLTSSTSQSVSGTVSGMPGTQTSQLQTNAAKLTALTVRFQAFNSLDLRSDRYLKAWKAAFSSELVARAKSLNAESAKTFAFDSNEIAKPVFRTWFTKAEAVLRSQLEATATDEQIDAEIGRQWADLATSLEKAKVLTETQLKAFLIAENVYLNAQSAALAKARDSVANGLTFEYSHSNPANQPKLSTARVAYTFTPATKSTNPPPSLTFNVAADFYETAPAHTGTLRDVQAALQLDTTLANITGKPTFTLAGYYQYQNQPAAIMIGAGNSTPISGIVLPGVAATLLAPKGNIAVAQGKLTFPLKNGTKLPVGITWSNRTELIKASEVRGHIGFDFDWSALKLSALAGQQAKN